MSWKQVMDTRDLETGMRKLGVVRVARLGERWLIRDLRNVYAYSPMDNRIEWQLADSGGGPMSTKELVVAGGVAVTAVVFGREDKRTWIVGLDPASGAVLWQRRTLWPKGIVYFGGLWSCGDHVILGEQRVNGVHLVWLSVADGLEAHACSTVKDASKIGVAGERVFVRAGHRLFARSAEPGAGRLEEVLDARRIMSLTYADDRIYSHCRLEEDGRKIDFVVWWNASTFAPGGRIELPATGDHRRAAVLPTDPRTPHRVLLHARQHLHLLDLESEQEIWHIEESGRIASPKWTPEGIFYFRKEAFRVEVDTGARGPSPFEKATAIHWLGDFVAADYTTSMKVYSRETLSVPEPTPDGWPLTRSETVVVETGVPADPREELQRAIPAAATSDSLEPFCVQLCRMFALETIPGIVREFFEVLRRGDLERGPMSFTSWDRLAMHCQKYRHLFRFDLGERFFPALLVASESGGVEFWMMLATGVVIDLHHDASFFEQASDVWAACGGDVAAFEEQFPQRGNQLTIRQLTNLQRSFAETGELRDLEDLPPEPTFRTLAGSLGWQLVDLAEWIGDFEYFMGLHETHGDVLQAIAVEGSPAESAEPGDET